MNLRRTAKRKSAGGDVFVSPFWQRTLAFCVDLIPVVLIATISASALGWIDLGRMPPDPRWGFLDQLADIVHDQGRGILLSICGGLGLSWGYGFFTEWFLQGTPGARLMGTRIVDSLGQRPTLARLAIRNTVKVFSFVFLGLGGLWAAFDRERRTVHDRVSGTYVIRMDDS